MLIEKMTILFYLICSLFFNLAYSDHCSLVDDDGLANETTASYLNNAFRNENAIPSNTNSINSTNIKSTDKFGKKYKIKTDNRKGRKGRKGNIKSSRISQILHLLLFNSQSFRR